jgi:hypothetical protein
MNQADEAVFRQLFKGALRRCFGMEMPEALSETESKLFCTKVLDQTGLVIGWKSIKNYSLVDRRVNPTIATLDTLARYVMEAPYTDEAGRKAADFPYTYWFTYKGQARLPVKVGTGGLPESNQTKAVGKTFTRRPWGSAVQFIIMWGRLLVSERIRHSWLAWSALGLFISLLVVWKIREERDLMASARFTDTFVNISDDSLESRGWTLYMPDSASWGRRKQPKGGLTLFTLKGDNWPDPIHPPRISNLLMRGIPVDCFGTEVRFSDFMPRENWQQAGILLLEDSSLNSPSIRLSIAFNNYFGGFTEPKEIVLQGVTSRPGRKGEEFLHQTLFQMAEGQENLVADNMQWVALRIEKQGDTFRFLYSTSPLENFAFKEATTKVMDIHPHYIALFAIKGYSDEASDLPVTIRYFSTQPLPCRP